MRGGLKGFYVFIACIALGVAAIAGVSSFSRALTEGIASEGQVILGGDLSFTLVHREATPDQLAYLQSTGEVSEIASLRAMARTQTAGNQTLVEMKAVDDHYPLTGDFELDSGQNLQTVINARTDGFATQWQRLLCWRALVWKLAIRSLSDKHSSTSQTPSSWSLTNSPPA